MRVRPSTFACVTLLMLCACSHRAAPPAHAASVTVSGSEAVVELLTRGDYVGVEHMFDAALKADVPASKLANVWSALVHQHGKLVAIASQRSLQDEAGTTDVNLLRFERGPVELIVRWSGAVISGILLKPGDRRTYALSLADLALRGDAGGLYQRFSPAMKSKLGAEGRTYEGFATVLESARRMLGAEPHVESVAVSAGEFDLATVRCRGAAGALDLKLAFKHGSDVLEGLQLVPADTSKPDAALPAYADPTHYAEHTLEVTVPDRAGLPATLTLPKASAPVPGVVLVHGSGPQDRDETVSANRPFRDLAAGLATRGIAVLRYEKRTFAKNRASLRDPKTITFDEETTDDAVAAVQLMLAQQGVDPARVFIVGHSQGGMAAPRIAAREPRLRGLVLMAAPARPFEQLIIDQQRFLGRAGLAPADSLPEVERQAARVAAPELAHEDPRALVLGVPVSWWLSLRGYSPVEQLKQLALPSLILQGGRDFQVTAADLALWTAAVGGTPWATIHDWPALNHLFESGEGAPGPAEYQRPGHVDEVVIDAIADWVTAVPAQSARGM